MKTSIILVLIVAALCAQPSKQGDIYAPLLSFGRKVVTHIINDSKTKKSKDRVQSLGQDLQQQIKNLFTVSQDGALQAVNQAIDKTKEMLVHSQDHANKLLDKVVDYNENRFSDLVEEAKARVEVYSMQSIEEHIKGLGKFKLNYKTERSKLIHSAQAYVDGIIKEHTTMFRGEFLLAKREVSSTIILAKSDVHKTQEEVRTSSITYKYKAKNLILEMHGESMRRLKNLSRNSRADSEEYVSLMNRGI